MSRGLSGRGLPQRAALAGIDLAAHRERALRALVLFFGGDLKASPAEWEARAEGVLAQLERYGMVPVNLYDEGFRQSALRDFARKVGRGEPVTSAEIEAAGLPVEMFLLGAHSSTLGEGPGA